MLGSPWVNPWGGGAAICTHVSSGRASYLWPLRIWAGLALPEMQHAGGGGSRLRGGMQIVVFNIGFFSSLNPPFFPPC